MPVPGRSPARCLGPEEGGAPEGGLRRSGTGRARTAASRALARHRVPREEARGRRRGRSLSGAAGLAAPDATSIAGPGGAGSGRSWSRALDECQPAGIVIRRCGAPSGAPHSCPPTTRARLRQTDIPDIPRSGAVGSVLLTQSPDVDGPRSGDAVPLTHSPVALARRGVRDVPLTSGGIRPAAWVAATAGPSARRATPGGPRGAPRTARRRPPSPGRTAGPARRGPGRAARGPTGPACPCVPRGRSRCR